MLGLIWIQIVCKGYQHQQAKSKSEALKVNKSLEFHPDNNYELLMEPWKVQDLIYLKGCMIFVAAGDNLLEFWRFLSVAY